MNKQQTLCIVISIVVSFLDTVLYAQTQLDSIALAKAKAEAAKAIAMKEFIRKKPIALAQWIAIKSWKVDQNPDLQGLLAKEAYGFNLATGGNLHDPYIYEAVYKAVATLKSQKEDNPEFNTLNQLPKQIERIGRIRAVKTNANHIYTISSNGHLLDWDFKTYNNPKEKNANPPTVLFTGEEMLRTLAISPDGKYLAFAGDGGKIRLYDLAEQKLSNFSIDPHQGKRVWCIEFLPNCQGLISVGDDGLGKTTICYTTLKGESTVLVKQTNFRVTDIAIAGNGNYMATVGKSAQVDIWNTATGAYEFGLKHNNFDKGASSVQISPEGNRVAVGYRDGSLLIWELDRSINDKSYQPERLLMHSATIADLEFSKDGSMLLVGSLDKTASLWSVWDLVNRGVGGGKEFPYQNPRYQPIKFENHQDWVTAVSFSDDYTQVVSACADGTMKIWEVDMGVYAEQICKLVGTNLSDKEWLKYIGTDDPNYKKMYIEITNNQQRTPLSTCGSAFPQRPNK